MYCSSCGARLPEGTFVCGQCHWQAAPVAQPGVHPACHIIAVVVGLKTLMGLASLWRLAMILDQVAGARRALLQAPAGLYLTMSISITSIVVMAACAFRLYWKDRWAWVVLVGLLALLLPMGVFGLYNNYHLLMRNMGGLSVPLALSLAPGLIGTLSSAAMLVLLLAFKRRLVREGGE